MSSQGDLFGTPKKNYFKGRVPDISDEISKRAQQYYTNRGYKHPVWKLPKNFLKYQAKSQYSWDDLLDDNTRNLAKYILKLYIPFQLKEDATTVMKQSGFDSEEYEVLQHSVSYKGIVLSYDEKHDLPGLKFYLQVKHEDYDKALDTLSNLVEIIISENADSLVY